MPNAYRLGRLLMARHVLRRARVVTAVSPYLAQAVRGMASVEIDVVANALPCASPPLHRLPRHAPAPVRGARTVMILSGWGKLKNASLGLLAMRRLQQLRPGTECHVVGPAFAKGQAGALWIASQGWAQNFCSHGALTASEVQALLQRMDLLIHPSLEESFGMTVAEAMAHGIPVVAGVRSGGVAWVAGDGEAEGVAGRLVDVRSAVQISDAALALLDSPEEYKKCSVQGLARSRAMFSPQAVVDAYEGLYQRARHSALGVSSPMPSAA